MGISINTVNVIGAKYDMQTKTLADESWSELEKICNILGYPFDCEDEEMHLSNVDIYDEFCPAYIEEQVLCHFDIDIIPYGNGDAPNMCGYGFILTPTSEKGTGDLNKILAQVGSSRVIKQHNETRVC